VTSKPSLVSFWKALTVYVHHSSSVLLWSALEVVFQSTATTFLYLLAFKGELFYISAGLSVLSSSTFS
jgi:hypothetical protein